MCPHSTSLIEIKHCAGRRRLPGGDFDLSNASELGNELGRECE